MKRSMKWLAALLVVALIAVAVSVAMKKRNAAAAAASTPASAPLAVELGPADVVVVRLQPLTRTLAISGGLKAVTSAVVKARVASEIKSLTVREGDAVKAGQVIGQLDTTEFDFRLKQAEQTALAARTQLDIAKRTLNNNRALVEQGFISPTGLETSVSTEAGAQASYQAAIAATELARKARADAVLVAPIGGIVSQRFVQPGERVGIEARVVEIVDLSRIELEAAVAPEDVGSVQVGQIARLGVDGLAEPATAKVARINPSTQAGTRAVMVYMALQPQPGLRQGLFARGSIELQKTDTLVAPVSAVRVDQARPYVLVVQGGRALQRAVELGVRGDALIDGRSETAVEILR
ncbi:MAG: efflux RND transporter periplasmic adaptor subunit, partial [Rhizobiales bacterium]|nr:efflux RND transporter periplasmic adaptor subunit [Rhizobacter sp.]